MVDDIDVMNHINTNQSIKEIGDIIHETLGVNGYQLGTRSYIDASDGEGYWDFFKVSDDLYVSINDGIYTKDTICKVQEEGLFKVRFLLEGEIKDEAGNIVMSGPDALLAHYPKGQGENYYFSKDKKCRLIILHSTYKHLRRFELTQKQKDVVCPPFSPGESSPHHIKLQLGLNLFNAATDMLNSRFKYAPAIRRGYIEAKSQEILCAVLHQLTEPTLQYAGKNKLNSNDLNRLAEAQNILLDSLITPPTLKKLARMVGMNETKLKAGFKTVYGCTVYAYIQDQRMSRAVELLSETDYSITQIAFEVGFEHPTNFSYAFKKYFGYLPKSIRKNQM